MILHFLEFYMILQKNKKKSFFAKSSFKNEKKTF